MRTKNLSIIPLLGFALASYVERGGATNISSTTNGLVTITVPLETSLSTTIRAGSRASPVSFALESSLWTVFPTSTLASPKDTSTSCTSLKTTARASKSITDLESFPYFGPSATTSRSGKSSSSPTSNNSTPLPMYDLEKYYGKNIIDKVSESNRTCNRTNVRLRRNWYRLDQEQRADFVTAFQCLHRQHVNLFPIGGARFRVDDFIVVHMFQGYNIQFSGLHFHWHRIFLHLYEEALRNECGYQGALPYWDFSEQADDVTKDPIFNGNLTSLGGDGAPRPHGDVYVDYLGKNLTAPAGSGGSCVVDTPLRGQTARLGKSLTYNQDTETISMYPLPQYPDGTLEADFLQFNDRCMTRDLNAWSGRQLNITHVEYDLDCSDFECFQQRINGAPSGYPYILNLANAARFAVGGLQLDPYAGPVDPIWWLTANNFDRLWAIWQGQNPDARTSQVAGTQGPYSQDTMPRVKLDTYLQFGNLSQSEPYHVANATSTIEGPLCYIYDGDY